MYNILYKYIYIYTMTSIFEKESFTLKELCGIFKNKDI